jgi:murein DD-endopeptidase MepM/ murein hydrolase activator NlpD
VDLRTQLTPAASAAASRPAGSDQRPELQKLAQEFESMFIAEMLRGMRASLLSHDDQDEGLGADTMTDTIDAELGRALSGTGGLGLAKVMLEALAKRGDVAAAGPEPPAADHTVRPADARDRLMTGPAPASVSAEPTLPGPVTSKFGWRADPFTGRQRFHAGTDVRLAYGKEVQSVAPGRVSSVADCAGYGLTVVIDHGNGLETRYAHLSEASVQVGQEVEAGQIVARSGNSGRSTGPHLHLEARQHGRPVEMVTLLKLQG